ncbi:MAG: hypothetical protein NZM25_10805 [Leptospiraceae bacterium]|nr:hypothetical protein [Leptospiraceae bacterium]MDW8305918.1 hypothetical protein [Leptospiraceae bacterium]
MNFRFFVLWITIFLVANALTCARFRISHLSPETLLSLPLGPDGAEYPVQNGAIYSLPRSVAVIENWFVIAEPSQEVIKIFNGRKLNLKLVSKGWAEKKSQRKEEGSKEADRVKVLVSDILRIPGRLVAGKDEDFFVENFTPPTTTSAGEIVMGGVYRILHYDLTGKVLHTIGRKGQLELPFENILWMDTDSEGNLWVLYSHLEQLYLDQYHKGKVVREFTQKDCEDALFVDLAKEKGLLYRCEFIYPFYEGKRVLYIGRVDRLIRDAERTNYQFFYRTLAAVDFKGNKEIIFSRLNDPDDYPYLPFGASQLLLWQTIDYQKVRLAVYNLSGELLNNLQIEYDGRHSDWRSTYMTLSGEIYSLKIRDQSFNLVRWK